MRPTRWWISAGLCLIVLGKAFGHTEGPLGHEVLDWQPDPSIRSVISLNFDFHAGERIVSWSPPGRVERRAGRTCVVGPYLLFDIDDRFAFDIDETVIVEATFYRPETDGFVVSYDQAIRPTAREVRVPPAAAEQSWWTAKIRLERARFANRKYYGTDLAFAGLASRLTHPKGNSEVTLCGLRVVREHAPAAAATARKGQLRLSIMDEAGRPSAAQVGLYAEDGKGPLPSESALIVQRYTEKTRTLPMQQPPLAWPRDGQYVFFADGSYRAELPEGEYRLAVMKGPEFRILTRKVRIQAGRTQAVEVQLERWSDPLQQGWMSGDDHIHIGRGSAAENANVLAFMQARDVRVANLLQMGNLGGSYFHQYAFGRDGVYARDGYFLVSGQESPRTSHRGHTIGLNIERFHWPERNYFFYDATSDLIRSEGGLWGYAHVAIDAFNVRYGLALDVPRGKVDFVEVLQFGTLNTRYLYDFLNMGFKLIPTAGSDYPYIDFPGSERLYVRTGQPRSAQDWFDALKSRRSFVTNWMTLDWSVNGDRDATQFEVSRGASLTVEALVRANPDFDAVERVELVSQGEVIQSVHPSGAGGDATLKLSFTPQSSQWLVVRAYGRHGGLLHSAPVYVSVDGDHWFGRRQQLEPLLTRYQGYLEAFRDSTPALGEEWEHFAVHDLLLPSWQDAKPQLDAAIEQALRVYQGLKSRAR